MESQFFSSTSSRGACFREKICVSDLQHRMLSYDVRLSIKWHGQVELGGMVSAQFEITLGIKRISIL